MLIHMDVCAVFNEGEKCGKPISDRVCYSKHFIL